MAFTDAAGALHMIGAGPSHAIPHENSPSTPSIALGSCVPATPSLDTLGCAPVGNTPRLKLHGAPAGFEECAGCFYDCGLRFHSAGFAPVPQAGYAS